MGSGHRASYVIPKLMSTSIFPSPPCERDKLGSRHGHRNRAIRILKLLDPSSSPPTELFRLMMTCFLHTPPSPGEKVISMTAR
ncbi:hypothetical protein G7K_1815-t1 [Saitoella complicata NRRL Y-17804]|uniref:Uncharacterized protein n=1 Tax=Saitoella complicata (strain BCRC 22490 / CBS 7301 / JCM 7358 / NBRC 10748 / NRRL Y-17804) TaxID=698492 RepID=A0A0E9NDX8_SAICN|nr:hypothetical protein G7K_1815-t1 [Saitoella complicata NRRL Y-17804]